MKTQTQHPIASAIGRGLGLTAGVLVTEVLTLVPKMNAPLENSCGEPITQIEGATMIGDEPLRARHKPVIGPKLTQVAERMKEGLAHDFVEGVADGATQAPGTSYRLEVAVSDFFER